jgi:predicted transcriptional regulator
MLTNQQKGNKTMRTLTQSAQVNKLLKAKAKQLNLNVTGHSKNFSMGCSVTIKVLNGSDEALNQLKGIFLSV